MLNKNIIFLLIVTLSCWSTKSMAQQTPNCSIEPGIYVPCGGPKLAPSNGDMLPVIALIGGLGYLTYWALSSDNEESTIVDYMNLNADQGLPLISAKFPLQISLLKPPTQFYMDDVNSEENPYADDQSRIMLIEMSVSW